MDEAALRSALTSQRPSTPLSAAARQRVLDAASAVQIARSRLAGEIAAGDDRAVDGAEVVAAGQVAVLAWFFDESPRFKQLLSASSMGRSAQLRASLPLNRERVRAGLQMVSLFDYWGTEPEARVLLANETEGTYLFGVAPVQMKIVDQRYVLLEGPALDGEPTLMAVTAPACLDAAWRYWEIAVTNTVPFDQPTPSTTALSPRQRQVLALMEADLNDEAIATALGVSVRTVRSDVAGVLEVLGVRSRFAAAMRLRAWDGAARLQEPSPEV